MTNLTKVLLASLLAAIAGGSTGAYAADCAYPNVPKWVHESEAFTSCPRDEVRNETARRPHVARDAAAPADRHHADAKSKAAIVTPRSPFRDDTAA